MNLFKNRKTNWKYVFIVVILAFFVGGGILAWQYWLAPKEEIKPPEVKPPEEVTTDETADWKIYQDDNLKYRVEYPSFFNGDSLLVEGDEIIIERSADKTKYASIQLPRKIEYVYLFDFETGKDKKLEINSIEDWMYAIQEPDEYGHGKVNDCYEKDIAGFKAAICDGSSISATAMYRERFYFLITLTGNFQVKSAIIIEEDILGLEISEELISSFFETSDQIINTFSVNI